MSQTYNPQASQSKKGTSAGRAANSNPGNQAFEASHFLISDLGTFAPLLPGSGSCSAIRVVPPRETVSNPAHLESFFVMVVSLISQAAGSTEMAGGRASYGRASRQQAKFERLHQSLLDELQTSSDQSQPEEEMGHQSVGRQDPEIARKLKKLVKRNRPQWEHAVSFEITGSYQQVSFILRSQDAALLKQIAGLLRQEYPHLTLETLATDPLKARSANRALSRILNVTQDTKKARSGSRRANQQFENWRTFDPLVLADDINCQFTASKWLLLSEHPTMPITLPGSSGHGTKRSNTGETGDLKATPLRGLLETLSSLEPGEIASSQLLVWGTVNKEWVKKQQARIYTDSSASSNSTTRPSPGPRNGSRGTSVGRANSGAAGGAPNFRTLFLIFIFILLILFGLNFWDVLEPLFDSDNRLALILWVGLALILLLGVGVIAWWALRHSGGRNKNDPKATQALEEKFSSPLALAALRQTVSLPFESYLHQFCFDPHYKSAFASRGFDQQDAVSLYGLRRQWLDLEPLIRACNAVAGSGEPFQLISLKQQLVRADTPQNRLLWEFVCWIANSLASKRLKQLSEQLSSAYSPFNSSVGNAFTVVSGKNLPAQSFSSLLPYDWSSPQRVREQGLESLWLFNTAFFDWVADLFDNELPAEAKEHRGLQIFNTLELAHLWHLPGGYESVDFLKRTGPKIVGPSADLLRYSESQKGQEEVVAGFNPDSEAGTNSNPKTPGTKQFPYE